jgi:AcrR family transcriptional regulator
MGIPERKAREKEHRREEILNAAERLFFSRGINRTTMDEIADEAELAKGTLYLYFKSREDIHLAIASRGITRLNEMIGELSSLPVKAIEKLVRLGWIFIDFSKKFPDYVRTLLFMDAADIQNYSMSREELKNVIFRETPLRLVLEFVEQGVEDGSIRQDIPPQIIANTLWSQLMGVIQFALLKNGIFELVDFTPEQLYENHLEITLNGIKA